MIAYLDTNVVRWLAPGEVSAVSRRAQDLIEAADLFVSPMVLLEIEYLAEIKRVKAGAIEHLAKLHSSIGLQVCQLSLAEIAAVAQVEKWTRDPFDRIIVANAKVNGVAPLITSDEQIRANYVNAVW